MSESLGTDIRICGVHQKLYENSLFISDRTGLYNVNDLQWLRDNYIPSDNEIWIVTYAKTGTTFAIQLCHQIMECVYNKTKSKDHEYYKSNNDIYSFWQWLGVLRTKGIDEFNKFIQNTKYTKRFWKTHTELDYLPGKKLPKKMIIVCRNPKDALVSFYHHVKNGSQKGGIYEFDGSFDTYFTMWVSGLVQSGSYFEYYKKYWRLYQESKLKNDTDIYWLNYENLIESEASKRNEIKKLIQFIGVDHIVGSPQDLDDIMVQTSVPNMQKQYKDVFIKNFVRKGRIGDWKHHFSDEQNEIVDALIRVHFNGSDFKYYKDLMDKKPYLMKTLQSKL